MINLAALPYPHIYRDIHPDCVPGCGYPYWVSDVHPVHCVEWSSRGLICHMLRDGKSHELELDVTAASATRDTRAEVTYSRSLRQHRNVVQLHTTLPNGSGLAFDFSRGETRSLAAALIHAADISDGLVTR